ncbi:MAG: DNA polymerase Y family protein [Acidobacteria bacterium]|nr:DNA polymerase Y family protein [Acidobacteriota bacterium]
MPALPLQLLVRRHPEWIDRPVAVVDEDKPQGKVLWVNERAYRSRVLPGTRYAAGLSLCRRLCAGKVHEEEIDQGVRRLLELLWRFTPEVEPSADEPGVFWVNAAGLGRIELSLTEWARRLRAELERDGFAARIAVGFSRFATYATARVARDITVFDTADAERRSAMGVRLDRLHIDSGLRDALHKLGIHTIEKFLELPPDGLGKRFGAEAVDFYKEASGQNRKPLAPVPPPIPVQTVAEFEYPEADANRLLFYIKRLLPPLLEQLASWHQGLTEMVFEMTLDDGTRIVKSVRPADATLDAGIVLDLARLRLGSTNLTGGVFEMTVTAHGKRITAGQLSLFWNQPKRDAAAADRALARVRAEFGCQAVVWAKPRDAHLPEASFTWEPLAKTKLPRNLEKTGSLRIDSTAEANVEPTRSRAEIIGRFVRPLVRRVFDKAVQLPARERREPDGWLIRGLEQGPAVRVRRPYVVSGGWWVREVHREYYFVETQRGDVLWIYYDRHRRSWMLQGQVN